jgi:hypothetical protein
MKFAADAYATGICEKAAGSEIEVLVDELDYLIDTVIEDAIQYRGYDSDGDLSDEPDDIDGMERYKETARRFAALRDEIKKYEQENNPDELHFHEDEEKPIAGSMLRKHLGERLNALLPGASMSEDIYDIERGLGVADEESWIVWDAGEAHRYFSIDDVLNHVLLNDMLDGGD